MKYFIDTEFVEPSNTLISPPILLLSIGIVAEDGREYYAQDHFWRNLTFDRYPWIRENVLPHLREDAWRDRATIRREVEDFINAGEDLPEFVFWCGCYDYVILCQLFGGMMQLPAGWPHSIIDLQQRLDRYKITDDLLPPQEDAAHNALADARYLRALWTYMANWPIRVPFARLKELGWPMWNMSQRERDRSMNGTWISDQEPLTLRNDDPVRRGGSALRTFVDGLEINPDIARLIGGSVGHEDLATTGGDHGQANELVYGATGDPEYSVKILQDAASDLKNSMSIFGTDNGFDADAYLALLQQEAASKRDAQPEGEDEQ